MKVGSTMAQMSFRIDEKLKKEMERVCKELGMTPTTALTIFIKKMCREKRIPFEVSFNSETERAIENCKNNRNLSRTFDTVEELIADLNAED